MVVEIRPEDLAENNLFTEELKTKSEELKATNKIMVNGLPTIVH